MPSTTTIILKDDLPPAFDPDTGAFVTGHVILRGLPNLPSHIRIRLASWLREQAAGIEDDTVESENLLDARFNVPAALAPACFPPPAAPVTTSTL